jgi:hypothetical protein
MRAYTVLLLPLLLMAGCSHMASELPTNPDLAAQTGIHTARLSQDLGRWPADALQFNQVRIVGDTLEAEVSFGGGCAEHDFALVFANVFLESLPVQMHGLLSHDAKGDPCRAMLSRTLRFDLTPLKEKYRAAYGHASGTITLIGNWPGRLSYVF